MSSRSFRSVFMVASCAGAALGCYLVSLRVASERAALEDVETKIVLAQRDMRVLQTEIDGRMTWSLPTLLCILAYSFFVIVSNIAHGWHEDKPRAKVAT